jgi:hypothetical protein
VRGLVRRHTVLDPAPSAPSARPPRTGAAAPDIRGCTPGGALIEIRLEPQPLNLFFLTSGCYGCRPLWEGFGSRPAPAEMGRVVLVTPSPSTESALAVGRLAPRGIQVVMSSDAWHDYWVTLAPWFVRVSAGVVADDHPAPTTWDAVATLLSAGG